MAVAEWAAAGTAMATCSQDRGETFRRAYLSWCCPVYNLGLSISTMQLRTTCDCSSKGPKRTILDAKLWETEEIQENPGDETVAGAMSRLLPSAVGAAVPQ